MPKNHGKANKERKRVEAKERQAAYNKLSASEKIDVLDKVFGQGLGATRQRVKLAAAIVSEQQKPEPKEAKVVQYPKKIKK
jgi:hypothetical protein